MAILLIILAVGAGVATFIENDYGAQTAQILVYKHKWYELVMALTIINMMGAMVRYKMWKNIPKISYSLLICCYLDWCNHDKIYWI
jgi:hypothetical protein